jgi:hypothetical protein
MKLESKLQYRYFEPGEFVSIEDRTFAEAVELIKQYPWYEQRDAKTVDLTCPSVTIRNTKGDYLKVGPGHTYFNLYLYTSHGKLLKRVSEDMDYVITAVKDFYDNKQLEGLYRERFLFDVKKHFETNAFEYKVTWRRILIFSWFKIIGFSLLFLIPLIFIYPEKTTLKTFLILFPYWFLISGINVLLLINYWIHDKKLILKISRGQDLFWYGKGDKLTLYNKKDIAAIREYQPPQTKNPWGDNSVFRIEFKNGDVVKFTNLLIPSLSLLYKTADLRLITIRKTFPFIKLQSI